jgi:hypothetical protein
VLAVMALAYIAITAVTAAAFTGGLTAPLQSTGTIPHSAGHGAPLSVVIALPVAMARSTAVEVPSFAIAQRAARRCGATPLRPDHHR